MKWYPYWLPPLPGNERPRYADGEFVLIGHHIDIKYKRWHDCHGEVFSLVPFKYVPSPGKAEPVNVKGSGYISFTKRNDTQLETTGHSYGVEGRGRISGVAVRPRRAQMSRSCRAQVSRSLRDGSLDVDCQQHGGLYRSMIRLRL